MSSRPIRISTALFSAAVMLCQPRALPAQSTIHVDGRRLQTGADSLTMYVIRGTDTIPTGVIRDELEVARGAGGAAVLRRTYVVHDRFAGNRVDSIFDRLETLSPVRQRSTGDRNSESLDFAPGRVTGSIRMVGGPVTAVDEPLPAVVFNSNTFDLVLRAADLGDGWTADVPAFLPSTHRVAVLHARVTGTEAIGGRPCWRIDADFTGLPVTFWVDRQTRQLRQQVMVIGPGTRILVRAPAAPRDASHAS